MSTTGFSQTFRLVLLFIALASMLAITSGEISGQGKKPPPPAKSAPPQPHVSRTKLQVRRVNDQIAYWVDLMTTTSPEVTLRYSTTEPGATQAEWHLLDKPFSSDPRKSAAEGPHLGGRGLGTIPRNGEFEVFEISLAPFPKPLAKTPRVFWVIVVTKNAQNQIVGVASAPVKIVYKKAPLGSKEI